MGYQREKDETLEHIGDVQLSDMNRIIVDIRRYGYLPPATAIIHEDYRKSTGPGPYLEQKIPRLKDPNAIFQLSELLATAAERLAVWLEEYDAEEE